AKASNESLGVGLKPVFDVIMHELKWRGSSLKPFKFMEVGVSRHKRSKSDSDPVKRNSKWDKLNTILGAPSQLKMDEMVISKGSAEARKRQHPKTNVQNSLNQEILKLQRQLEDQLVVRHALENALSYQPLSQEAATDESIPKPTKDLIKEITVLELEILYLERYLLSLYRKTFDQQMSSVSTMNGRLNSALGTEKGISSEASGQDIMPQKENSVIHSGNLLPPRNSFGNQQERVDIWEPEKLLDSSIHRSHSSLSQRSACSFRASPRKFLNKAVDSYHSLPLSMLEQSENATPNVSLAEHLGTCLSDHVPETPNCLSEEMVRCVSAVCCELADPPLINRDYTSPPVTFSSSIYEVSSDSQNEKWSSLSNKLPFFNSHIDNPFHFGGSEAPSGPYCRMLKVQWICRDTEKLRDIDNMLQKFRSLVYQLEKVDLRKMKHEEKLAFWINVHNALVMHAFLVYGIPQNNLKRASLLLKAAYNVGGHTISVDMIQNSILGCRLPRPGQWLRLLFSSKTKFKVGDARKAFAIEHPEPLLHFALCSGSQSDPAVRVYTPKRVFEELETAKEEYIQSTFIMHKEHKILLPKIVESFAKDSGLSPADLVAMVEHFAPDSRRKTIHHCQHKKIWKGIEWIPHNFTFHFLLSKEVAW
ncbi:Ternary complex factor MIP1, leucine-zipper, partial [Parasponia andersonii]